MTDILEKLAPKECFIISKTDSDVLVVENREHGEVVVRKVPIPAK
jgi:hypothetical protein